MLSIACNDGKLLAVFAQSIELVCKRGLQRLTSDIRQLRLSDQRFGFGADQLLFEDDDSWRVGLLVLQLRNLIRDLLLPY